MGIHKFPGLPFFRKSRLLGLQTEQLPLKKVHDGRLSRNLKRFRAVRGFYEQLFEWNPSLHAAGLGGELFIPYGCELKTRPPTEKQFDVLFIGNIGGSPRRKELLDYLATQFKFYPDYSPGFGTRKSDAIHQTKICLNIHFYDDGGFESPRIFDYLSHGAFVISESALSTHPFAAGHDLEEYADKDELVAKLVYYLENDQARQRIADQGYETAGQHGFESTARLLADHIKSVLDTKNNIARRFEAWIRARSKCGYFSFRDYISLKRRDLSV
ncbi:glycosyltransferase [Pseudomonadota bacterium]